MPRNMRLQIINSKGVIKNPKIKAAIAAGPPILESNIRCVVPSSENIKNAAITTKNINSPTAKPIKFDNAEKRILYRNSSSLFC